MKLRRTLSLFLSLTSTAALLVGCTNDRDQAGENRNDTNVFESDLPGGNSNRGSHVSADSSNGSAPTAPGETATDDGKDSSDAQRAIEEADIFKIEGNRLYALSQYGGLNVIDMTDSDNLRLLGRKQVVGSPFEMYVRESIVFALYNGYGEYVESDVKGEWSWIQTSYVIAFDTTNAAQPQIIGKFPIPGNISDSRIVGNILYVVGFEANGCWNCEEGQHTTVLSLDISSPESIHQVDRLSFTDDTSSEYSWQRSISVTNERMYVAGPEWSNSGPVGSTIQVIDISDPKGDLVEGVTVQAAGSVNSRWQMDEYNGVLRVISQPGSWSFTDTVRIQTYQVDSATSVKKLANVAMEKIPENESLRSVRFDGERAYAITAEQMDPLFTIDLSKPAEPRQAGELEMPGWVYHMEPRGNRMVSLGYDQGNANGALAVSLFDVTNLDEPKMLDRVNFGGDWAWIQEGQDQVHKAFQVLDDNNLVLMPFSGWESSDKDCGSGRYNNGIQLIDWKGDDLTLSGVANLVGQPRRGFLHDERLFAISDERVETFDITNRKQPLKKDSLKTAHIVQSTVAAGNTIVKIAQDWYTNTVSLDTTTLAKVEQAQEMGHIDLSLENNNCGYSDLGTVAASDSRVYLLVNTYDWSGNSDTKQTSRLVTVDVTSAKSPKVIGDAALDFGEGWSYWNYGNLVNAGAQSVAVGNTFAMLSTQSRNDNLGNYWSETVAHVLDVTNPKEPKDTKFVVDSDYGTTGLFTSGSTLAYGYYKQSASNPERVRFYVDRIDVSEPAAPERRGAINVPGTLIGFDASSNNTVTANYRQLEKSGITSEECYEKYGSYSFNYKDDVYVENGVGTCQIVEQSVQLSKLSSNAASVLGSKTLEVGQRIGNVVAGTDRLFMTLGSGYGYAVMDCMDCRYGYSRFQESTLTLLVLGGLKSDDFTLGKLDLSSGDYWGYAPMAASEARVVLSTGWQGKLVVVDGSDPSEPVIVREAELAGNTSHLTVTAGVGIASLYYNGVQTIPVAD